MDLMHYKPRFTNSSNRSVAVDLDNVGKETILLVEDDQIVRRLVRCILEADGLSILEAVNGQEALEICEGYDGPLDMVLTDVVMPQMSGPSLLEKMTQLRPRARALFMSGYANNVLDSYGGIEGIVPFLQKPFSPDELVHKVREVLDSPAS